MDSEKVAFLRAICSWCKRVEDVRIRQSYLFYLQGSRVAIATAMIHFQSSLENRPVVPYRPLVLSDDIIGFTLPEPPSPTLVTGDRYCNALYLRCGMLRAFYKGQAFDRTEINPSNPDHHTNAHLVDFARAVGTDAYIKSNNMKSNVKFGVEIREALHDILLTQMNPQGRWLLTVPDVKNVPNDMGAYDRQIDDFFEGFEGACFNEMIYIYLMQQSMLHLLLSMPVTVEQALYNMTDSFHSSKGVPFESIPREKRRQHPFAFAVCNAYQFVVSLRNDAELIRVQLRLNREQQEKQQQQQQQREKQQPNRRARRDVAKKEKLTMDSTLHLEVADNVVVKTVAQIDEQKRLNEWNMKLTKTEAKLKDEQLKLEQAQTQLKQDQDKLEHDKEQLNRDTVRMQHERTQVQLRKKKLKLCRHEEQRYMTMQQTYESQVQHLQQLHAQTQTIVNRFLSRTADVNMLLFESFRSLVANTNMIVRDWSKGEHGFNTLLCYHSASLSALTSLNAIEGVAISEFIQQCIFLITLFWKK